jgi:hypothetical protein
MGGDRIVAKGCDAAWYCLVFASDELLRPVCLDVLLQRTNDTIHQIEKVCTQRFSGAWGGKAGC